MRYRGTIGRLPRTALLLPAAVMMIAALSQLNNPTFGWLGTTVYAAEAAAQGPTSVATSTAGVSSAGTVQGGTKRAPQAKSPRAKSKAEFEAYQNALRETKPAKAEAVAVEFAQRYPSSELRSFLFQRAMGLYQQADNSAKALEMARAVLKYDPANAVALLGAAQLLAEGTHEHDLDRDARLQEAADYAGLALQHAGELTPPAGVSAQQFERMIVELRAEAHEVLATVAYKRRDYRTAIDEYNAAVAGEKDHVGAVLWLRLAAAHDKLGEYSLGIAAAEKAIAASEAGSLGKPAVGSPELSKLRELAQKELVRLKALAAEAATRPAAAPGATPSAAPAATPAASRPIEKTQNSRSPGAGE